MATTINASTSGLIETSDGTAVLALQTGGTNAVTVNATQAIGVGSSPSYGTAGQFLTSQGSGASPTWTSGGSGTVTSVGWTGGIVSIATATTTPAFTIAGTSGGIPYFSSGTTWASSAALTQYGVVYGGGAGAAPVATAAGTTGQFLGANTGGAPTWQTPSGGGSPGGSNTYVQYNSSGSFAGSANLVWDNANGRLGVGVASPATSLEIDQASGEAFRVAATGANQGIYSRYVGGSPSTGNFYVGVDNAGGAFSGVGAVGILWSQSNQGIAFGTNNTQRMLLDSTGNLLIGTITAGAGAGFATKLAVDAGNAEASIIKNSSGSAAYCLRAWNSATTTDNAFIAFQTEAGGTQRGSITYNRTGGLTAYNTTSDYRAKDIVGPVVNSGDLIDSVPVYMGKMKDATQERPMFIAHEVPDYARTGEKDAVDANGDPIYQQMDASALIPVLWAEVKSLRARIAALEAK